MILFSAQDIDRKYLDSVNILIRNTKNHHKKARIIMRLSDYWSYRDTAKAFQVLETADPFIGNNEALKGLKLIFKAGIIYSNDIDRSQKIYMQAEEILKNIDEKLVYEDRAILWHNYAALEQLKGNTEKFMRIVLEKCIPLARKSGNKSILASYHTDIGFVMNEMKNYHKAIPYLQSSIKILSQVNDDVEDLIWAKTNLVESYTQTNQLAKAKQTLNELEALYKRIPKNQYLSLYYQYLTDYYITINKKDSAIISINKGIDVAKKMNIPYDVQTLSYKKFTVLRSEKNYTEAEQVMKEILSKIEYDNAQNKLSFVKDMASLQEDMGKFGPAYQYLRKYLELRDTVDKEQNRKNTLELEAQYNTSEKEKKLLSLENKSRLQRLILLSSLFFATGIILFFVYALNQRKKRNRNEIIRIEQERKLDFSKALLEGEEQERKRIARELHDGLGGRITGVKLALENSNQTQTSTVSKSILQLENILTEVRQTARNLMPESIQKTGLENALKDYCYEMSSPQLKILFYSNSLQEITDKNIQLNIYRIVQELVTNGIRHGNASEILINITHETPLLLLDYEDNGQGFDMKQIKRNFGMNNIETRVKNLNGSIIWKSEIGKGTTTNIEVNTK